MNCLHSSLFTAATVHLGRQPSEDGGAILPSRFSFRSLAFRTCATATDQQSADYKPLHPDVSIDLAIEAACRALGRAPGLSEAELAEKLRANWFSSAADIAQMTDSQASALGFPLKLKAWLTEALASNNSSYATEASLYSSVDFEALQTGTRPPETTIAGAISDTEVESDEESEEIASSKDSFLSPARVSTPPPAAASLRGAIEEQPGWETLPIEERVCPSKRRFGYLAIDRPNVVSRSRATKYALGKDELTESLKTEFAALHRFGTTKFFGAQADPIEEVTANKYADHLRGMLGWLHRVRGVPLEELSLRSLVPSNERGAVATTFDYAQWLVTERSINVRTELLVLRSVLFAAKFLYHDESAVEVNSSSRPYSDLTVVKELRTLIGTANKAYKVAPRVADETMKWLDWPEYLNLCRELKKECALLLPNGKQRVIKAVAVSVQRYLMFAILACVPDRQRTLRELQVGKTLVKEGDRWIIRHGPKDYKTGKSYGERPPLVLNPTVYPELEAFITKWRAELDPQHDFLFTQANGKPYSDTQLSKFFMVSAYRITGKRLTPHMVRDSIVTFLRKGDTTERELEALALYMGHSIEMQRSSYDRRTKEEKVGPAVALLEALNEVKRT